ncbi:MAG: hypothetical protein WAW75_04230 [Gallionella sp.]
MKIEMLCSVDPNKDFFKVKGDKSGRVWFDTDATQAAKLVQLVLVPEATLVKVTVEIVHQKTLGSKAQ